MAADTAALVVALSAQLTKFEKDMKGAVNIADRETKRIEQSFGKMNANIQNKMTQLVQSVGVTGGGGGIFGAVASSIRSLGPIGATAATGVIAFGAAFAYVSSEIEAYAKKVDQLRNASETLGISITQLNELNKAGLEVGVTAEIVETSIGKMTVAVDQLKSGSGPLVEILRKINPALLDQVASAATSAEAIDILAKAFVNMGNEFEKNAFLRAMFGRGGLPFGRVLQQIAGAGGLKGMEDQAVRTGKAIDEKIAKEVDDLKDKIQAVKNETTNMWAEAFGPSVLNGALKLLEYWQAISKAVTDTAKEASKTANTPLEDSALNILLRRMGLLGPKPLTESAARGAGPEVLSRTDREQGALAPAPKPPRDIDLEIRKLRDEIAAAGDAATAQQKYKLELLEVTKAQNLNLLSHEQATQRLNLFELATVSATLALKEKVGIISEEEFINKRLIDLYRDAAFAQLTFAERLKAIAQIRKEALKDFQEFKIKQSDFPQLARLAKEAGDLNAQIDKLAVSTFGEFENAMADIAVGASTVEEAFKKMADSIIRDLVRMVIRMSVTLPIAQALQAALSGAGGLFGPSPFTGGLSAGPPGRQHGGPVGAGRPYIVGEHGPELFVPGRSGQIVPNQVSKSSSGAGLQVIVNNTVSNDTDTSTRREQGPGIDRVVIDIVKRGMSGGQFDDVNQARFGMRARKVR